MDEYMQQLRALYLSAWGQRWPRISVSIDPSLLDDEDDDNDEIASATALLDKLGDKQPVASNRVKERRYECLQHIEPLRVLLWAPIWFPDTLVVRDEYHLLYDALENNYADNSCIIIAGHPGIGKTMFLIYALLRRLEHRLPTAIHFAGPKFVLFTENGVSRHSAEDSFVLPRDSWALSDGNCHNISPCLSFRTKIIGRLVHTALAQGRMEFAKQRRAKTLVSELPTIAEIAAIARTAGHDASDAVALARRWGPCIHTIMDVLEDTSREAHAASAARIAARRLCANPRIIGSAVEGVNGEGSAVVFLRPHRTYEVSESGARAISRSGTGVHYIPTQELASILGETLRYGSNERALELFDLLNPRSLTKSYSATALAQRMHGRLFGIGGAPRLALVSGGTQCEVRLEPADDLVPGTLAALKHIAPGNKSLYWLPTTHSFPGIDSALIDGHHIYVFHASDAAEQISPREGLAQLWRHLPADVRAGRAWRYVVVCDAADKAAQLADHIYRDLESFSFGPQDQRVEVWSAELRRERKF